MIGITDKNFISSHNTTYSMFLHNKDEIAVACYHGFSHQIFPSRAKQGAGFKEGDVVETIVNLSKGTVEWKVNNKTEAKL